MANIVMVIAPEGFRDEELHIPYEFLAKKGHSITIASTKPGICHGKLGMESEATIGVYSIRQKEFDAIVLIGGPGAPIFKKDINFLKNIQHFYAVNKLVAAICIAPTILAAAKIITGKNITVWHSPETDKEISDAHGLLSKKHVVVDENIITGDGPDAAKKFAKKIHAYLKKIIII